MEMTEPQTVATKRQVWNAGRIVGAKRALKPKQIWQIRFYLNQNRRLRDRALFVGLLRHPARRRQEQLQQGGMRVASVRLQLRICPSDLVGWILPVASVP